MKTKAKEQQSIIDYINDLINKATKTEQVNIDESLKYSFEALELAEEHQFTGLIAKSYVRIGRCKLIESDFNKAISYLLDAVELTQEVEDIYTEIDALISLGMVYAEIEIYDQSVSYYNRALLNAEDQMFEDQVARTLNNLGTLHEELGDYDVALNYYQRSLDYLIKIDEAYPIAVAQVNLSNVYVSLGKKVEAHNNIILAIEYAKKEGKTLLLAHAYLSIGLIYVAKEDYDTAIDYLLLGEIEALASKNLSVLYNIYMELGNSYDLKNQFDDAKDYYMKAYESALKIGKDELMPRIFEKLASFYEKNKMDTEVMYYYKKFHSSSKIAEEKRRIERIKSIDYQSRLSVSLEETKVYQKLSNELTKSYESMHVLSNIGQSMTATLKLDDILDKLYDNVNLLMSAEGLYVGIFDEKENLLRFDWNIEHGKMLDSFTLSLENEKSWLVWGFLHNQTVRINDIEKEYKKYIKGLASTRGELMYSAMYSPLMVEGEVIGMFSIQTKDKNAYTETHKDLLKTLSAYLAIAIKNANKSKQVANLNKLLKIKSENDGLTGIPNRRLFDEVYNKLWIDSINTKSTLSVLIIDIDNFKDFNDTYGHLIGDEVVKSVAEILHMQIRNDTDFVARYGGDEFVAILPNTDMEDAVTFAEGLSKSLEEINTKLNIEIKVTLSIGIACTVPKEETDKQSLIYTSDNQLYLSKANGKNQVSATYIK